MIFVGEVTWASFYYIGLIMPSFPTCSSSKTTKPTSSVADDGRPKNYFKMSDPIGLEKQRGNGRKQIPLLFRL